MPSLFIFFLGREYLLSIAEICATFPCAKVVEYDRMYLILRDVDREDIIRKYPSMGGTIKVVETIQTYQKDSEEASLVTEYLAGVIPDGKIRFALGYTDAKRQPDHIAIGIRIKNQLKALGRSSRLVNKDRHDINSAVYRIEKLGGESGREVCFVAGRHARYMGATIVYQDVDAYAERDLAKERDMDIGMLPPKLAQIMIHLAGESTCVFDPFVGLGTVLIEAMHAGCQSVLGSDLSPDMVDAALANVLAYRDRISYNGTHDIWMMDASKIQNSMKVIPPGTAIVTEGYLGRIFTPKTISDSAVKTQRDELLRMYDGFFAGLAKLGYRGRVVITLPVWNIGERTIRMDGIDRILDRHGYRIIPTLPEDIRRDTGAKYPTLIYRRPGQTVGREVCMIGVKA